MFKAEIDCRNLSKSRGVFGLMASKTATEYLQGHCAVTHYFVSLFSYAPIMSLREAQMKVVAVFSFFYLQLLSSELHSCGGPQLSRQNKKSRHYKLYSRQNKINSRQNNINSRQNKENQLVSGWSAVASEIVRRVTVNKRNGGLCC